MTVHKVIRYQLNESGRPMNRAVATHRLHGVRGEIDRRCRFGRRAHVVVSERS
jgi:hypothetical protein